MSKTLVEPGYIVRHTVSGSAVVAGEVLGPIATNERFRIAKVAGAVGVDVACYEAGVHELAATTTDVWADGDKLYFDPATDKLTDVAGALKEIGTARGAKANGETTAKVLLNNTPLPAGY